MKLYELKALCDQHDPWPLFERLLGYELRPGKMYKSPFRDDDQHPSFGIYRGNDGKTRFKDFAGHYGDIYEFIVQWNDVEWKEAVKVVAGMLGITPSTVPLPKSVRAQPFRPVQIEKPAECSFEIRPWRIEDNRFWGRWNIPADLMETYNVHPCRFFEMTNAEGKTMYWSDKGPTNPLYVYRIGHHLKLYRPYAAHKNGRYIGNTNRDDIFGIDRLSSSNKPAPTVICAGQKDALTMMANFDVRAIAFNSESLVPAPGTMLRIAKASQSVHCLYDNDETGVRYSTKLCTEYPFVKRIPFEGFAPKGIKDVSDLVESSDRERMGFIANHLCLPWTG